MPRSRSLCGHSLPPKGGNKDAQKYLNNQPIVVVNRIGASGQIRSAADTEKFMHEQYELYERIPISLGVRQ